MPVPLAIPAGAALAKLAVGAGATAALGSKVYQSVKGKKGIDLTTQSKKEKEAEKLKKKKQPQPKHPKGTHLGPKGFVKTPTKTTAKDIQQSSDAEDKRWQEELRKMKEGGQLVDSLNEFIK